jgi:hypothetical protein
MMTELGKATFCTLWRRQFVGLRQYCRTVGNSRSTGSAPDCQASLLTITSTAAYLDYWLKHMSGNGKGNTNGKR